MNFRRSILSFAGAVVACSGLAYGQSTVNCTTTLASVAPPIPINAGLAAPSPLFIRSEGQTELLPALTLTCVNTGAATTANANIFVSPATSITSKLLNASTGATEAVAVSSAATPAGTPIYGTASGSVVIFSGFAVAAGTVGAPSSTTVTFTNIRINATTIPSVAGAPPTGVTVQAFISGTNVTPGATGAPTAAFVSNGLGGSKTFKDLAFNNSGLNTSSFGVCGSLSAQSSAPAPTPAFVIQVNEAFQTAFKANADEAGLTPSSPGGSAQTLAGVSNTPNSGTRIKLTFNSVPAGGLQIYVPVTVTAADGAVLTLTSSETGALQPVPAITGQSNVSSLGGVSQVAVSGTTAVAVYEVTVPNAGIDVFGIPVYFIAGTNTLTAQTAGLTVTTSLAPQTSSATVPSFGATQTSATTLNLTSFNICSTTLLFPFVTNQAGFETGIAIANTSVDPFGSAKPQSGTCTLNYYGTSSTNPTKTVAPNTNETAGAPYLAGETYAFTLTSALAVGTGNPATFQGYVIAACNFEFAHGFAYITYAFPGASSDTMGYLALSLARGATSASTGTGGFNVAVDASGH